MSRTTNVIRIPRPPASAFNKDRPAGTLLQAQALHLRESLIRHLAEVVEVLATPLSEVRTEGQVSAYAHRVTKILHPHGATRPGS